jgi:hypothetical protein
MMMGQMKKHREGRTVERFAGKKLLHSFNSAHLVHLESLLHLKVSDKELAVKRLLDGYMSIPK